MTRRFLILAHSGYFQLPGNSYRSRIAKYEQVTFAHRTIESAVGLMAVILGTESPLYFPRQSFSFRTARCMIEIHIGLVVSGPTVYMDKYGTLVAALILPVHAVHRITTLLQTGYLIQRNSLPMQVSRLLLFSIAWSRIPSFAS